MIFSHLRWIPTPSNFLIEFGRITRAIFFNIGGQSPPPPCPPCRRHCLSVILGENFLFHQTRKIPNACQAKTMVENSIYRLITFILTKYKFKKNENYFKQRIFNEVFFTIRINFGQIHSAVLHCEESLNC